MTRKELENSLRNFHPDDGFRVRDVSVGQEQYLYLCVYAGGTPIEPPNIAPPLIVFKAKQPNANDYGRKVREKLLFEAITRFMNTGGSRERLKGIFNQAEMFLRDSRVGVVFRQLIDSHVNTDGDYEHLFAVEDSDLAIRWVEGQFVDIVTMTQLGNELRQRESQGDVSASTNDSSGTGVQSELLDSTDPAPATGADGPSVTQVPGSDSQ